MAKIERKYMAHYIDAALPSASKGSPNYVRLGKDLEEYSPELSANVEKKQNIPVSYTHLTLPTTYWPCRSRWSPYH